MRISRGLAVSALTLAAGATVLAAAPAGAATTSGTGAIKPPAKLKTCSGTWAKKGGVAKVVFHKRAGKGQKLTWDLYITKAGKDWFGPGVITSIEKASVNGKAIKSPYKTTKAPTRNTNFKGSLLNYTLVKTGKTGTIKKGDRLVLPWHFLGSRMGHMTSYTVTCKVPA
ncbi:hypothetical protein GCM10023196_032830 [Actinoallomurus vinaceus]|uniref:Secreted protein n=1 Tax=Actinoallomurus vinaceus TaxID=1080074 RepID=A0ABP8U9W3_9ACTN